MSVKRKWLTRITVSILTCVMILSVAGCGDKPTPTTSGEKITIEYAGWDYKYISYEYAEEYEKTHPNIDIVLHDSAGEWVGNEYLNKMAAANTMPDIINVENPDHPIANDWVIDLKPYLERETDLDIPQVYLDNGTYNNEIVMVPHSLYISGVIINLDLLEANNVPIPEYNWSMDDFSNIARATTKPGKSIGTHELMLLMRNLPAQANPDLGWAAFNHTTKHYQLTPEWIEAANVTKGLYDSKVSLAEQLDAVGTTVGLEAGTAELTNVEAARKAKLQELVGEDETYAPWFKGKVAMLPDVSWGIAFDDPGVNSQYVGFKWDYYPMPALREGDSYRPGVIQDSRGITTSCENPDAAWEYLKYTTFSAEGAAKKLDIMKTYDQAKAKAEYPDWAEGDLPVSILDNAIPVTSDQQVLDDWAEFVDAPPGLLYCVKAMDKAFPEAYKVVPAYKAAYLDGIEKQFIEQVLFGIATPADIAADLEAQANAITDEAYAAMTK